MNTISSLYAAVLFAMAGAAQAGASVSHQRYCEVADPSTGMSTVTLVNGPCSGRWVGDKVMVQASVDSVDIGKPGAIYVGMTRDGEIYGQFSATGSYSNSTGWRPPQQSSNAKGGDWVPFQGGLFTPAEAYTALPSEPQTYMLVDGPSICSRTGGGKIELWVGYGALDAQEVLLIKQYKTLVSSGISEEHLMLTRIQGEMRKKERAWNVLNISCPPPDFGASF